MWTEIQNFRNVPGTAGVTLAVPATGYDVTKMLGMLQK